MAAEEDIFSELVEDGTALLECRGYIKKQEEKKREAKMSEENKELFFSCLRRKRRLLMQAAGAKTSLVERWWPLRLTPKNMDGV